MMHKTDKSKVCVYCGNKFEWRGFLDFLILPKSGSVICTTCLKPNFLVSHGAKEKAYNTIILILAIICFLPAIFMIMAAVYFSVKTQSGAGMGYFVSGTLFGTIPLAIFVFVRRILIWNFGTMSKTTYRTDEKI